MRSKGFTLMELMVVVLLIGIIAAFALPNYDKSIRKAHERDMVEQLRSLHAASLMYKARNGTYWNTSMVSDILVINSTLGIHLISNEGTVYSYFSDPAGIFYMADAGLPSIGTAIRVTQAPLSSANPCCASLNCLSVPNC